MSREAGGGSADESWKNGNVGSTESSSPGVAKLGLLESSEGTESAPNWTVNGFSCFGKGRDAEHRRKREKMMWKWRRLREKAIDELSLRMCKVKKVMRVFIGKDVCWMHG